jgi:hypothetical protein
MYLNLRCGESNSILEFLKTQMGAELSTRCLELHRTRTETLREKNILLQRAPG